MKNFAKNHIFLIIILIILFSFPVSLSSQARLNNRIIVTGLAIDKAESEYEITAQVVKTSPSSKQAGSASIEFVSDKDKTITGAISKLLYKTGKMTAFSHTGLILLGDGLMKDDLTKALDYFVRDNVVEDSVLLACASGAAKDELKKTKDIDVSVGIGLQKVFSYKQKESDGVMTSLLSFLKCSKDESGTVAISEMKISSDNSSAQGGSQGSGQGGEQQGSEQTENENSAQGGEQSQSFEAVSPINCFVGGVYAGKLKEPDEIEGFMLAKNECSIDDLTLENVNCGKLNNATIGVKIKHKTSKIKLCYQDGLPCLEVKISIKNAEIKEIQNDEAILDLSKDEFDFIKKEIAGAISKKVAACFNKSQELGADIFGAYKLGNRFYYRQTKHKFATRQEFLSALKFNVSVATTRLEY